MPDDQPPPAPSSAAGISDHQPLTHSSSQHPSLQPLSSEAKAFSSDDVLTEILLLLPAKSLARCKSVSKRWLSIISAPRFRRLHHLNLHQPATALFLFRRASARYTYLDPISLSGQNDHDEMELIATRLCNFHTGNFEIRNIHSCKGLMCVHTYCNTDYENQFIGVNNQIYAYNPLTFQHRLIPNLNTRETTYNVVGVTIVFEPLSDNYKIVCVWEVLLEIVNPREKGIARFSIYSSKTRYWSNCRPLLLIKKSDTHFKQGVVWNGNVHWCGKNADLLCLDVAKECFRVMPSPQASEEMEVMYFGESDGHLHLIRKYLYQALPLLLDILVLDKDYAEWSVKYRVDLTSVFQSKRFLNDHNSESESHSSLLLNSHNGFKILSFVIYNKEGREKLVISVKDKIISCDINYMEIEELAELTPLKAQFVRQDISGFSWFDAFQFIKSDASV